MLGVVLLRSRLSAEEASCAAAPIPGGVVDALHLRIGGVLGILQLASPRGGVRDLAVQPSD